eukprot:m.287209 g.287209  ORF g.287209 m.287209 type:complete len:211 (+) comp55014_c0_seq5:136-768(+)
MPVVQIQCFRCAVVFFDMVTFVPGASLLRSCPACDTDLRLQISPQMDAAFAHSYGMLPGGIRDPYPPRAAAPNPQPLVHYYYYDYHEQQMPLRAPMNDQRVPPLIPMTDHVSWSPTDSPPPDLDRMPTLLPLNPPRVKKAASSPPVLEEPVPKPARAKPAAKKSPDEIARPGKNCRCGSSAHQRVTHRLCPLNPITAHLHIPSDEPAAFD